MRTKFRTWRCNDNAEICAPEGRLIVARRIQRREEWEIVSRPVGTLKVLTHTLQPLGMLQLSPNGYAKACIVSCKIY